MIQETFFGEKSWIPFINTPVDSLQRQCSLANQSINSANLHAWLHSQFPSRSHHPRQLLVASCTSKSWITLTGIFIHIFGSQVTSPSSWLSNLHVTKSLFFSRTPRKGSLSRSLILSIKLFRPKAGLELCGRPALHAPTPPFS